MSRWIVPSGEAPQLDPPNGPIVPRPKRRRRSESPWLLIMLVALLALGLYIADRHSNTTTQHPKTHPTVSAAGKTATALPTATVPSFAAPTPTPTGAYVIGDADILGGTITGFTNLMGDPIATTPVSARYLTKLNEHDVVVIVHVDRGTDGHSHVSTLNVAPPAYSGTTWDAATTLSIAAMFLPSDAQHAGDNGLGDGIDHHYTSADLALTFPAALFTDTYGNRVTQGTFILHCGASYCQFQLGK